MANAKEHNIGFRNSGKNDSVLEEQFVVDMHERDVQ